MTDIVPCCGLGSFGQFVETHQIGLVALAGLVAMKVGTKKILLFCFVYAALFALFCYINPVDAEEQKKEKEGPSDEDRKRQRIPEEAVFVSSSPTHDTYKMKDSTGGWTPFHAIHMYAEDGTVDKEKVRAYKAAIQEELAVLRAPKGVCSVDPERP